MREKILKAMAKNNVAVYRITETETEGAELYFIKKELDMRRQKNVHEAEVVVYRDFEADGQKMRGASTIHVFPEMPQEKIDKVVGDAYYAASFVKNPYFELPKGKKEETVRQQNGLSGKTTEEIADAFVRALYAGDNDSVAFINTSEFFVSKKKVAICTSEGTDVSYEKTVVNGEFIVQCTSPQDVELYQDFSYDDLDTDALRAQAAEALKMVRQRAMAQTAPKKGTYKVILSGKELAGLMRFYTDRSSAGMIYPEYSQYKKGTNVQGDAVKGEKLNLTLHATNPYSEEGIPMKDLPLVADGELLAIHGNARFSYYLDVPPTGTYGAVALSGGTKSVAQMKKEPYLHAVSFSDFSMDSFTGYFGGEIRLAYLFDGEKEIPVTGGSVSGNFCELQKDMAFSTERYKDSKYDGPFAVELKNVAVAGC